MKKNSTKSRREFIKLSGLLGSSVLFAPLISHGFKAKDKGLNQSNNDFFVACKKGELSEVKVLLEQNQDLLTTKDQSGKSGFAIALLHGHHEIGDYLKKQGYKTDLHESVLDKDWDRFNDLFGEENKESTARINKIHPMGGTAIWAAAAAGVGKDMWRVYAGNCKPNIQSNQKDSSSPLEKALEYSDLKKAEITAAALLSNNADPNPKSKSNSSPLHTAAKRGSLEMIEMLVRLGADVNYKDQNGRTALDLASYYGQNSSYDLIKNHSNIPRTCRTSRYAYNSDGEKYHSPDLTQIPIHTQGNLVGSSHRDLEEVKKQVSKNPLLAHSLATTSESAVEAGAHMGRKDMVEFLLKSGAPYSLPTAVFMEDFSTVKKLLREDPNRIHERGAHDFGLLWYSVIGNANLKMAQLLMDHGAKVEDQHFLGTTALHWACFRGPLELIELFVENGANVNRIGRKFTEKGETPLQSTKDEKIINYLKSKGAK